MSKGRKQSREKTDASEIFSDADFDTDDFVEQMDEKPDFRAGSRSGWRRLEEMREERLLRQQLNDIEDWHDFDD